MESKSLEELQSISQDKDNYTDDARMAAVWEIEKREGISSPDIVSEIEAEAKIREEKQKEFQESVKPPQDLPVRIKYASYLLYATLVISAIATLYQFFVAGVPMETSQTIYEDGTVVTHTEYVKVTGVFPLFIFLVVYSVFFYFVHSVSIGKNWARITLFVLFLVGLPFTLIGLPGLFVQDPLLGILSVIQLIPYIVAFAFLFTGEAHQWYKGIRYHKDVIDDF